MSFESILFERGGVDADQAVEPDYLGDLNLDRVLQALTAGREEYRLESLFHRPLHEVGEVGYRHEALRDLERPEIREPIERFAAELRQMRRHLEQSEKLHYRLQQQAWFLEAVEVYCRALAALGGELSDAPIGSRALEGLRDYVGAYLTGARFTELAAETRGLDEALSAIRYAVRTHGARVTVFDYEGEPDYSAEVAEAFAKFQQGAVRSYLVKLPESVDMNHVEAQILTGVARLNPDTFAKLADYCDRQHDYLDPAIARFDREVQFYLGYLELTARLGSAGLPFCYPRVSRDSKDEEVAETFDLALAIKLVAEEQTVVTNDFALHGAERVIVVTGPNNGGKTTFARTFGQLHHLAALGLLIPGARADLFLPDRIYTHFEREEDIETLRGKFEDELVRVHEILEQATGESVIVMNESFSSTTLNDALFVGGEIMQRILDRDCLGVYVTFVDELASLGDGTVSMVSQIVPQNPAERTFKVLRAPADGLAYAWAIADKYGLSHDRLLERIGP